GLTARRQGPGRHHASRGIRCQAARGQPRRPGLWHNRDLRAAPASLGGQQRVPARAGRARHAAVGALAGWLAGRDDGTSRPSMVRGLPVPSRTQVAPDATASSFCSLHRGRPAVFVGRIGSVITPARGCQGMTRAGWPSRGPFLIAGPCAVENDSIMLAVAERLAELGARLGLPVWFKASFDKANRSNHGAARGPGLDAGLEALERVRAATGLPILTDIHLPEQAPAAAAVVDALQIPAFLCRQTDLLLAAGTTGLPINIKKGQWMTPEAMAGAVAKVRAAGS